MSEIPQEEIPVSETPVVTPDAAAEPTVEEQGVKGRRGTPRHSEAQWRELEEKFIKGTINKIKDFATAEGIEYGAMSQVAAKNKWRIKRRLRGGDVVGKPDRNTDHEVKVLMSHRSESSAILMSIIDYWYKLHKRLLVWEESTGAMENPSPKDLKELRTHFQSVSKAIPEIGKYIEMLEDRAKKHAGNARIMVGDKFADEMLEEDLYRAELEEAQKVVQDSK